MYIVHSRQQSTSSRNRKALFARFGGMFSLFRLIDQSLLDNQHQQTNTNRLSNPTVGSVMTMNRYLSSTWHRFYPNPAVSADFATSQLGVFEHTEAGCKGQIQYFCDRLIIVIPQLYVSGE